MGRIDKMKEPNLLYQEKKFWIDIKGNPEMDYPYGLHEFYLSFDFEKFVDRIDLSKYDFVAGVV